MFVIKESRPGKAGNRQTVTATPTFSVCIKRDQQNSWQPCRHSNWLPPKQTTWSLGSHMFVTSGTFWIFATFHGTLHLENKPFNYFLHYKLSYSGKAIAFRYKCEFKKLKQSSGLFFFLNLPPPPQGLAKNSARPRRLFNLCSPGVSTLRKLKMFVFNFIQSARKVISPVIKTHWYRKFLCYLLKYKNCSTWRTLCWMRTLPRCDIIINWWA